MSGKLRTFSKKTPVVAPLFNRPLPVVSTNDLDGEDELDAIISSDSGVQQSSSSNNNNNNSSGIGKRKEVLAGKENNNNIPEEKKEERPLKKSKEALVPTTPTKSTSAVPTTPSKSPKTPTTPTTPTTPRTPKSNTKSPKTPSTPTTPKSNTKSPKSPRTPRTPKTPTTPSTPSTPSTPTNKIPTSPGTNSVTPPRRSLDTRALKDELEYLLEGMDDSEADIRRQCLHRLAVESRKGMKTGVVGELLRTAEDDIEEDKKEKEKSKKGHGGIHKLVDALLHRWGRNILKDRASFLLSSVLLHSLARDPANIPHLSRCLVPLRDIIFSPAPAACGDAIEKQSISFVLECGESKADDDYIGGNRAELEVASSMAVRTIAALSFTRSINDSLRQEQIVEGVVQLLLKWIAKLPTPPSVAASSSSTPNTPSTTVRPDVHSLLDIKYSLIILENATFMNPTNQRVILRDNCDIIDAIIKLIYTSRDIILSPKDEGEQQSSISLRDAATDSMVGCLKLLLNLTYDHEAATNRVRIASGEFPSSTQRSTRNTNNSNKNNNNNDDNSTNNFSKYSGLAVIVSLLNIRFREELFDVQQHILGLLVNLVETNPLNRQYIGSMEAAIPKIVSMYIDKLAAHPRLLQRVCNPNNKTAPPQREEGEGTEAEAEGLVGAGYVAMLLGWLTCDVPSNARAVIHSLSSLSSSLSASLPPLPSSSSQSPIPFTSLSAVLELFLSFQLHAGILPEDAKKSLVTVIQVLKSLEKK